MIPIPLELLSIFDHIWAVSEFCKESIERYTKRQIHMVPNGIQHTIFNSNYNNITEPTIDSLPFSCKFLCIATFSNRKNLECLINAFINEFPDSDSSSDACLILKTHIPIKYYAKNIFNINNELTPEAIARIIKSCNYIVSSSLCEGFFLPGCEAIACNKKIIAPFRAGLKTYTKPEHIIPVPFTEVDVPNSEKHYMNGKIAHIEIKDMQKSLRIGFDTRNNTEPIPPISPKFFWLNIALSTIQPFDNDSFLKIFVDQYMPKLCSFSNTIHNRTISFFIIFEYLERKVKNRPHRKTHIIETGCTRVKDNFMDGNSTFMFDHFVNFYDGKVTSIDINPYNCKICNDITSNSTTVICDDSVHAIHNIPPESDDLPIDLVYLDSFDLDQNNPHPSAMHHLKELTALLPKLRTETLIVIDDHASEDIGKGKYISDFFQNIGITRFINEYQIGYLYTP
jgi:hypothetical protein